MKSDTHILKMLMAAGAELQETRLLECDDSLQDLARKNIRNCLKKLHPEKKSLHYYFSVRSSTPNEGILVIQRHTPG